MTPVPPNSPAATPPPRSSRLAWALVAALAAFILGLLASPWFEAQVRSRLPGQAPAPDAGLAARVTALEARASRIGPAPADLADRLARLEARVAVPPVPTTANPLDRIRAGIAAGVPTDALGELQAAYGPSEDVAAAAALAARPVTTPQLRARLPALGKPPAATSTPPAASWAERARAGLQSLVTVRRATEARTDAFVAEADAALAADDPAAAIAAVVRLPASPARAAWLADARRLADGRTALARLDSRAAPAEAAPPAPPPTEAPADPATGPAEAEI